MNMYIFESIDTCFIIRFKR